MPSLVGGVEAQVDTEVFFGVPLSGVVDDVDLNLCEVLPRCKRKSPLRLRVVLPRLRASLLRAPRNLTSKVHGSRAHHSDVCRPNVLQHRDLGSLEVDPSDAIITSNTALYRHRRNCMVMHDSLGGDEGAHGMTLLLRDAHVLAGLECLDGAPILVLALVGVGAKHFIVRRVVRRRHASPCVRSHRSHGCIGSRCCSGGGVGTLRDGGGPRVSFGVDGGLGRRLVGSSHGRLALLIVDVDLVVAPEPLLISSVHPADHPGHEGEGNERLPHVDHVLGVDRDDDDEPRVRDDRVQRRQHEHSVLLNALGLAVWERHDAQPCDDEQVECRRPHDGTGPELAGKEARAHRLDDGKHDLGRAGPESHQREVGDGWVPALLLDRGVEVVALAVLGLLAVPVEDRHLLDVRLRCDCLDAVHESVAQDGDAHEDPAEPDQVNQTAKPTRPRELCVGKEGEDEGPLEPLATARPSSVGTSAVPVRLQRHDVCPVEHRADLLLAPQRGRDDVLSQGLASLGASPKDEEHTQSPGNHRHRLPAVPAVLRVILLLVHEGIHGREAWRFRGK
mmetsp:Transcript_12870/g.25477  ORF Transcript_12870/g.25477 Transcript_12870/m.25477 type:complete len:560 (-) Transcript_12870:231-1910(-)